MEPAETMRVNRWRNVDIGVDVNAAQAKAKYNKIAHQYPDTTRKGWEVRKAFAKECGIDVKIFNKGLGPQYDRFLGIVRGIKEIHAIVPADERSIKQLHPERDKLKKIVKGYHDITKPKTTPAREDPLWYGWYALNHGLEDMEKWADQVVRDADNYLKDIQSKRR
jgi:hypothetical protein